MKNGKSMDFPFLFINQLYKARVAWKYCSNDDYWKFVTYLTKRQCSESLSFKEFLNNKC